MTEDQALQKYEKMIYKLAHKYEHVRNGCEFDDLTNAGMVGLIKAHRSFNADHGTEFITYAHRCVESEISSYVRKIKGFRTQKSCPSRHLSIEEVDPKGVWIPAKPNELDFEILLEQTIAPLDKREQYIMRERFLKDRTWKSIGQTLGISSQRTLVLANAALKKIRERFIAEEQRLNLQ